MERWEIRSSPSPDDPQRHMLLLQGGMADVAAILKKFGAMCGRPSPVSGEGFNLSLVLHKVTPESRGKLDEWLAKMAPVPAAAPAPTPIPAPAPTPAPAALPPMPSLSAPPPPPPAAAPPGLGALPPAPAFAPPTGIGPATDSAPGIALPPALASAPPDPLKATDHSQSPAIPSFAPPAGTPPPPAPAEPPKLVSLTPEAPPPAAVPPPSTAPKPGPSVSDFPTEVRMAQPAPAAAAPAGAPAPAPAAGAGGALAPTEPLREGLTFESLLVGAYNRFAHAAAMSVVSSPGSMYNPLFLYGVPGTGKTHLLNAIGASMSKGLGDASLLMTSGSRLSRAIATPAGSAEIDKKIATSKALFVDDIHLMAVTDGNKAALAKVFKSFFDKNQQVVITSLYPPRALAALEEALKFSFSKGWSVDLKIPSPNVQKDLVASACDRLGAQLSGDDIVQLAEKLGQWGYPDLTLWVKRVAALRRIREAANQSATMTDMLQLIYEPIVAGGEAPAPGAAKAGFQPPPATAASPTMAVIAPKGQDGLGPFAASVFYEVGGKNGFKSSYRHVLWETYDASQQVGVPFQIADMCQKAGVTKALIVGPGPDSPLAPRAAEFGHAVRRILESVGVQAGWIPFAGQQIAAHYMNAHLDFQ